MSHPEATKILITIQRVGMSGSVVECNESVGKGKLLIVDSPMMGHQQRLEQLQPQPAVEIADSMSNVSSRSTSPLFVIRSGSSSRKLSSAQSGSMRKFNECDPLEDNTPLFLQQQRPKVTESIKEVSIGSSIKGESQQGINQTCSSSHPWRATVPPPADNNNTNLVDAKALITEPSPHDVVLDDNLEAATCDGAGHHYRNNPVFADLLFSHAEAFSLAPLSTQALIVQAIATRIERNNGRFLECHGRAFRQVSGQPLFLGIAQALFHQVQLLSAASPSRAYMNSNSVYPTTSSPPTFSTSKAPASTVSVSVSASSPPIESTSSGGSTSSQHSLEATLSSTLHVSTSSSYSQPSSFSSSSSNSKNSSILNLYMDPIWSSESMTNQKKCGKNGKSNPRQASTLPSSSRKSRVSLPMTSKSPLSDSEKVTVVRKKTKLAYKMSNSGSHSDFAGYPSDASKPPSPIHLGTQGSNGNDSETAAKAVTSNRRPYDATVLATQRFHEETCPILGAWMKQHGTLDAMHERAAKILPTLNVDTIPRGVTVRPSGKWQAQFYFEGQSRYIGVFEDSHSAALAYECVHRLMAVFREILRLKRPIHSTTLTKEIVGRLFGYAREAALKGVGNMKPKIVH